MTRKPVARVRAQKWTPHLQPLKMEDATDEQLAAMQVSPSSTGVSPYVRTLAHDPESYVARTTLFNAIMYAEGGLDRKDRELGALIASIVNHCVYCASVHARRFVQLGGDEEIISTLYLEGLAATQKLAPRTRALIEFCEALSRTPIAVTPAHVSAMTDQGFSKEEIIDLMHAAAIFGWANRLMHPLGASTPKAG